MSAETELVKNIEKNFLEPAIQDMQRLIRRGITIVYGIYEETLVSIKIELFTDEVEYDRHGHPHGRQLLTLFIENIEDNGHFDSVLLESFRMRKQQRYYQNNGIKQIIAQVAGFGSEIYNDEVQPPNPTQLPLAKRFAMDIYISIQYNTMINDIAKLIKEKCEARGSSHTNFTVRHEENDSYIGDILKLTHEPSKKRKYLKSIEVMPIQHQDKTCVFDVENFNMYEFQHMIAEFGIKFFPNNSFTHSTNHAVITSDLHWQAISRLADLVAQLPGRRAG